MAAREDFAVTKLRVLRFLKIGKKSTDYDLQKLAGTFCEFDQAPVAVAKDGAGAAVGATGDENVLMVGKDMFEYHILGAGQTIVSPVQVANGLNIGLDQADNEGLEITQGILAGSKHAYTIGTSEAFYLRVVVNIAVVAGTDDFGVGFRLAEAYQANVDDYNDFCMLNAIEGAINIESDLGDSGTTTTDTTDTIGNATDLELEIRVDHAGAVTYLIDGAPPTVTAALTITSGIVVVPFLYMLQANASQTGVVLLKEWECGLLSLR